MYTGNIYQFLLPFNELYEDYQTESIEIQPNRTVAEHQRQLIRFSYWIDESISKSELGRQWLMYTIECEESYRDEKGKQRNRVLVRAEAYSERSILQQIYKYGDKAELIDPPELRERMRKEVERIHSFYQK